MFFPAFGHHKIFLFLADVAVFAAQIYGDFSPKPSALPNSHPEIWTRAGETKIRNRTIQCGRRFFAADRDDSPGDEAAAIVGGRDAQPGEFPFLVLLIRWNKPFCGGSLLSSTHVLTAGHCLYNKPPENLKARIREYDTKSRVELPAKTEEFGIRGYVIHPGYVPDDMYNDVGVAALDGAVAMDQFAQPICLPPPNGAFARGANYMVGRTLTVAGWGATEEGGHQSSILQKLVIPVVDNPSCQEALEPYNLQNGQLCAGYIEGGKDACQGDSGGPLFTEEDGFMVVEGIVSIGIGCAREGTLGVYTRVSDFVPWITSVMSDGPGGRQTMKGHQPGLIGHQNKKPGSHEELNGHN